MSRKSAGDIRDLEYDWLASDGDGHVALLSTAGGGYAPEAFLDDTEAHYAAIDVILALPVSTTARFVPGRAGESDRTWRGMAERGVFAFDSDPNGGPYGLVAAPEVPARLEALPAPVREVLLRCRYPDLGFEALTLVSPDALGQAGA